MVDVPRLVLPIALLLGGLLCISCQTPQQQGAEVDLVPCGESKPEADLLCGHLAVPENYDEANGRQVELFVMVAPAIDAGRGLPPMYVLEGGPGAAASNFGEFAVTDGQMYRQERDIVMVDLRGAGRSQLLHCPELDHTTPQAAVGDMYPLTEVEACVYELGQKADLTQYTTANAVRDLESVRQWFGHEQIDIQALSYGTRLALEYIRRHPERVRRLVAIGTVAPSHRAPLHHAESFQRAFDLLLEDCETDADCAAAYPALREDWVRLLEQLSETPARFQYGPADDAAALELVIRREVVAEKLRSAMYFASAALKLPQIVDAAARGDWAPFVELALPEPSDGPPGVADGPYLSITCAEDVARITPADVERYTQGTYLGDYRVAQQKRACSVWPKGEVARDFGKPVVSSVPALLITGDRDPVTPPSNAEEVAATLDNARVIIVPHAGHLPFDGSDPICIDQLILDFLSRDDPATADDSCVATRQPPGFALP